MAKQEVLAGTRTLSYAELFGAGPSKRCAKCRTVKPVSDFHKMARQRYQSWCKQCRSAYRVTVSPPVTRRWNLKKNYGISPEEYDELLQAQNNHCACCDATMADRSGKPLHVDHEHRTGLIRGLLCSHCNRALGNVSDDPARLRRLAAYLEAHHG